jgi:hypothetical protein
VANRVDTISTPYGVLVAALGKPGQGDVDKTLAQWDVKTLSGWVEVYDYKSEVSFPEDVREWHVQAHDEKGFELIYDIIRETASRLGMPSGIGES